MLALLGSCEYRGYGTHVEGFIDSICNKYHLRKHKDSSPVTVMLSSCASDTRDVIAKGSLWLTRLETRKIEATSQSTHPP